VTRNPDYWKQGRPHLDGIEWTIIKDVSTRNLAFIAGKVDLVYGVTIPQLKDIKGPGVAGDLRGGQRSQRSQSDRQPRQAAL
jgi:ABC-type transport system substrate-binding protein